MILDIARRSVLVRALLNVVLPAVAVNELSVPSASAAAGARRPATVIYCATSLDGFLARSDGGLDWLPPPNPDSADDLGFEALQNSVDRIFMGRKTYEVASGFNGPWPYSKPVDVITSTLTEVPERLRGKVYFTSEAPSEHLQTMAGYGIKRVYVDGGTLITSLLREDAVDVMTLTTVPVLLGDGVPLFRGRFGGDLKWTVVGSPRAAAGLVQTTYRRDRNDERWSV